MTALGFYQVRSLQTSRAGQNNCYVQAGARIKKGDEKRPLLRPNARVNELRHPIIPDLLHSRLIFIDEVTECNEFIQCRDEIFCSC